MSQDLQNGVMEQMFGPLAPAAAASLQQLDAGQDSDRAGPEEEPCLETAPLVQMLNTELQLLLNLLSDRKQRHTRARLWSGALTGSDAY